ncbi:hypothetical protein ABW19_dt0207445 [Dactylella cylindrospora]|nr:hypothetical protein ABW19_dt0207445 [Dactylella cylindrospora]
MVAARLSMSSTNKLAMLPRSYGMPRELWAKPYWESNGYFGCKDKGDDVHNTWFFFLVKEIIEKAGFEDDFPKQYDYVWYKMAFFTTWSRKGPKSILCLDCPDKMVASVQTYLEELYEDILDDPDGDPFESFNFDPYYFHQVVLHGVVHLYDASVWKIKEIVRAVEKERSAATHADNTDYLLLHEAARHVIHSTETLTSANEVLTTMMGRHREIAKQFRDNATHGWDLQPQISRQIQDHLAFHHTVLHGIKCRSESLQARHTNEISLALNLVTALDTKFMKAIAVLTVLFLPATTIATIFGMSFFDFGESNEPPDITMVFDSNSTTGFGNNVTFAFDPTSMASASPTGNWAISDKFWIFWAWAVPCTLAVPVFFVRDLFKSVRSSFGTLTKNIRRGKLKWDKREKNGKEERPPAADEKVGVALVP